MTFDPTNPPQPTDSASVRLPAGVTEEQLLALIEGELGEAEGVRIRRALASDPAGRAWLQAVASMSADRTQIRALETPPAPARVMAFTRERVRDIAAREMIVEPVVHEIPVSKFAPESPGVLVSVIDFFAPTGVRRTVAAAAGFMLAGSIIVWGAMTVVGTMTSGPTIAGNDGDVPVTPTIPAPVEIAANDTPKVVPGDGMQVAIDDTSSGGAPVVAAPVAPTIAGEVMSMDDALAMAMQGRLVLIIRAPDPSLALARVDNVRRTSGRDVVWRSLPSWVESDVRVAMGARDLRPDELIPTYAGEDEGVAPLGVQPMVRTPGDVRGAYSVTIDQTARDLEILRRTLRQRNLDAEFIAIDEPVLLDEDPLDPDALFWWNRSPARWAPTVRVPIVVQPVE